MALVTTPAVVLRTYPYSETSKIVRLATRDLGVQSAIAKGVLRPKSRFAAGLELFSEGVAQLYHPETRELQTLAPFDLLVLRRELAQDVRRFAGATAQAELMLQMAPPAPPPPAYDTLTPRPAPPPPARRGARPPPAPLRPPPLRGDEHSPRPRLLGAPRVAPPSPSPKRDPGPRPRPGSGSVRRFVVGTAGHIDHGKTALVKALTGVDTDRWEEEKRRGITIDLGFAPLPLADTVQASIVDVPGHEAFVKNILAGATGIDVALLVVAADEGTMPQTEEHLAILELLGVQRGIPVIAKADLVDREWLELVRAELVERLAKSRVRWEPPVTTSAVSGAGLAELRAALAGLAAGLVERPAEDLFRLPIDRVFAVAGAGTGVTRSTPSGSRGVREGLRLPLPPFAGPGGPL